jgi:hypothetical protein
MPTTHVNSNLFEFNPTKQKKARFYPPKTNPFLNPIQKSQLNPTHYQAYARSGIEDSIDGFLPRRDGRVYYIALF